MAKFENTPEYQQMIKMQPACSEAISNTSKTATSSIERFPPESPLFVLDQQFAIDVRVKLGNQSTITGQEKALSNKFHKYRTFTMEFWQNRYDKEPGEFFKIASQFYLHGYSDETGVQFEEYLIINVLTLMNYLKGFSIEELSNRTKPAGGSRASFLPIRYNDLPQEAIMCHYLKDEF